MLNSDDPSIQNSDLTDDYLKAIRYFNLTLEDLIKINKTAINSVFLPEKDKHKLHTEYLKQVNSFKEKNNLISYLTLYSYY